MMNNTKIRDRIQSEGLSITEFILNKVNQLKNKTGVHRTLLAACPNSETVIKAALRSAKRANAPIKFAATLNQVDTDGGYTKMTQFDFVRKIREESRAIDFDGPIIIALDHGGPWLKDIHTIEQWDLKSTMDWVKHSLEQCVKAGYDLLHIDPTVDISLKKGEIINIDTVADRTIELIVHIESFRRKHKYPRIAYEVGTEEVHGGLADLNAFRTFLNLLKQGLNKQQLPDVWPCFVVGKVGTDLHTTLFDPKTAVALTKEAAKFGSLIKGHSSDNVSNPEAYPFSGMGAANVGPEFTEAEYDGLTRLVELEEQFFEENRFAIPSKFKMILENAVIDSGRWKKWLLADEQGKHFKDLSTFRQLWLIKTGCRYVWANENVYAARRRLYDNLYHNGVLAEEVVLSHIERAMDKYFFAFNLVNLNDKLE